MASTSHTNTDPWRPHLTDHFESQVTYEPPTTVVRHSNLNRNTYHLSQPLSAKLAEIISNDTRMPESYFKNKCLEMIADQSELIKLIQTATDIKAVRQYLFEKGLNMVKDVML